MKTSYPHKLCASVLAISIGCAFTLEAAVLMHEDWSGMANGSTAVSAGNWTMANGLASQIEVAINGGGYTGNFITPVAYGDVVGGLQLLPILRSAQSYTFGSEGLSLSAQVALASGGNTSNYFRIGLRSATNSSHNYWIDLYGTYLRFQKQAGTVTTLGSNYDYVSATTLINNLRDLEFDITPIVGGNRLTLSIDGTQVLSFDDTTGSIPSFADGVFVTIGMRSPRVGYVGEVTLQSIPEPGHIALGMGGIGALLLSRMAARRRTGAKG